MADFNRKAPSRDAGAPSGAGGCVISAIDVSDGERMQTLMLALGLDDFPAMAVPAVSGSSEAEGADEVLNSLPEEDLPIIQDLLAQLRQADQDEVADEDSEVQEEAGFVEEDLFGAGFVEGGEEEEVLLEDDKHPKEDEGVAAVAHETDGLDAEAEFYRSIGLQLMPGWKFGTLDGQYVGKVRCLGALVQGRLHCSR